MIDPRVYSEDQNVIEKVEKGLTSVEAAALYVSGGRTTDPELATHLSSGDTLNMDAMQRAHLRRMMGFDFKVRLSGRKLLVSSKEGPKVRTHAKVQPGDVDAYGNIISEELIGRLVEACIRLKVKWEKAQEGTQ